MRGDLVQDRYWGETSGPYSSDGWAHMGDLGFVDESGYLHVVGRVKDIIIRGGTNINPYEVESMLRGHPRIVDACVVARPDADLGESVVEQEVRLVATESGVPAEKPEASLGHEAGQVMLAEVHVVMRGDERHLRLGASRAVVDALARMTAGAGPAYHRRRQPDELPHDLGHPLLRSAVAPGW